MFATFLGCLEASARLGNKATLGNIQKMNPHLTRGQVERACKKLESEGYLYVENEPYGRTGKKIWKPAEGGIINLCSVTRAYSEVYG